jgi:hypothetical protein
VFWYVPVQTAVVSCGALRDVDARDSKSLFGDSGRTLGGMGDAEVSGDEDEFVVGTWMSVLITTCTSKSRDFWDSGIRKRNDRSP